MQKRIFPLAILIIPLLGSASCNAPAEKTAQEQKVVPEVVEILSLMPATAPHCLVLRDLEAFYKFSAGFGPSLPDDAATDWLLLPAPLENVERFRELGIATDRPIIVAHLSGDPGTGAEQFLLVLPIINEVATKEALIDYARNLTTLVDHDQMIVATSPHYEADLGAVYFHTGRWLLVGLAEAHGETADPESVIEQFGGERAVSLSDWLKVDELHSVIPHDWSLFVYWRDESGMRVIGIAESSRGAAFSARYDNQWSLLEPVTGWAQPNPDIGWLGALFDAAGLMPE